MIAIDKTLVSDDLLERKFVCDLAACKGECCVAGDSGAPLEPEEEAILTSILPEVIPYMNKEGIKEIKKSGVALIDSDGDLVTPLVDGVKHCAFVIFEDSIAKCAIEKAYYDGKIKFKKPVSCHLYPVRITKYKEFDAVNYQEWDVCKPACSCGEKLDVPVYKFLKEPLVRKYGKAWYKQLELVAEEKKSLLKK
ncbi:MAG: DUF3109 family protein [Bacteroidetes bacterium]|nr:DUF3109 family protein [Bacteroidota bacterium]MBK9672918.1 DUF3109 family protein [Bacteroidota bacterium]MBK9800985.1 DUF3109 family protein [Bacteroidota bacterium]MBP6413427.1 DUF3109 family protein [Bacteroidia bacterium]